MDKRELLAKLNEELATLEAEAEAAFEKSKANQYDNWDEELERIEGQGSVWGAKLIIQAVQAFGEEPAAEPDRDDFESFICPACKTERPWITGHGDCRACDDCCTDYQDENDKTVYCHPY